jgi:hypothetical protein
MLETLYRKTRPAATFQKNSWSQNAAGESSAIEINEPNVVHGPPFLPPSFPRGTFCGPLDGLDDVEHVPAVPEGLFDD